MWLWNISLSIFFFFYETQYRQYRDWVNRAMKKKIAAVNMDWKWYQSPSTNQLKRIHCNLIYCRSLLEIRLHKIRNLKAGLKHRLNIDYPCLFSPFFLLFVCFFRLSSAAYIAPIMRLKSSYGQCICFSNFNFLLIVTVLNRFSLSESHCPSVDLTLQKSPV